MPGRKCKICQHKDRTKIDLDIASENGSLRAISDRYDVPIGSLKRHKESGHVAKKIAKSAAAKEEKEATSFLEMVTDLRDRAEDLYKTAKEDKDVRAACGALREMRGAVELHGKATGELKEKVEHSGTVSWVDLVKTCSPKK